MLPEQEIASLISAVAHLAMKAGITPEEFYEMLQDQTKSADYMMKVVKIKLRKAQDESNTKQGLPNQQE